MLRVNFPYAASSVVVTSQYFNGHVYNQNARNQSAPEISRSSIYTRPRKIQLPEYMTIPLQNIVQIA